ncbi:MAG: diaminopimelate epimerase [Desulfobacteraceae bacterium]|jgi:diaminopimelate epimerase|nr:diaminopimelate epimerase [Desulfobacteraceae bacterium]
MPSIPFTKMCGSGNDFIVIDNREDRLGGMDPSGFARKVCRRRMSVGADGLILLENDPDADFCWRFFNSDGSVAEMCGNGARCAARFAYLEGIAGATMRFRTLAGFVSATVNGDGIRIRMTDPQRLQLSRTLPLEGRNRTVHLVNTGVPHAVLFVSDPEAVDVVGLGRQIRWHEMFAPEGVNANFVFVDPEGGLVIRTYERGVEDETLACGTGCVAAAVVSAALEKAVSPITLRVRSGGDIQVAFDRNGPAVSNVFLSGDARIVSAGRMEEDSWRYGG